MRQKKHKGVYPRVLNVLDFAEANPKGKVGIRVTTEPLIAQATALYPGCRCMEDHGLIPGLSLHQVNLMGAGCTGSQVRWIVDEDGTRHWVNLGGPGWVCPALDKLRRLMGH